MLFEGDEIGLIREESMGVAALYSYTCWFILVSG